MARIEFKDVSKRYGRTLPLVINRVQITIEHGEFCVFVGPSGCGKSTLLRMVAGLEDITSGELLLDGVRANELAPSRRGVAMVFQSYALYPHMSVAENMAFGLRVLGSDRREIDRKVQEAAAALQLEPLLDRLPKELSGGQRQRVAIGRAIVKEPRVFLFDEPLSNLDAALRVQTRLEIAQLHRRIGSSSTIYVTHDQVEAMTLADKIVLLHAGGLIEERGSVAQIGSPLALYHRPTSLFVAQFMGSPKMNVLPARLLAADAQQARVAIGKLTAMVAVDATHLARGAPIHIGVRPEHLALGAGHGTALAGRLQHVERLGDSSLLYVHLQDDLPMLTVKADGHAAGTAGENVLVRLLPQHLHLFNAEGQACRRTAELPA